MAEKYKTCKHSTGRVGELIVYVHPTCPRLSMIKGTLCSSKIRCRGVPELGGEKMIDAAMGIGVLIGAFGVIAWALSAANKDRGEKDDRDQAGKGNGPESH